MTGFRRAPTRAEIREAVAQRRKVVADLLHQYVAAHGCPCGWAQFELWAGKDRPAGSMDDLQNCLVAAALELPVFTRTRPSVPEYWLEDELLCSRCGARWKHFSQEWRMLAFHEQLIRLGRPPPNFDGPGPRPLGPSPSLEAWAAFMRGEPPAS